MPANLPKKRKAGRKVGKSVKSKRNAVSSVSYNEVGQGGASEDETEQPGNGADDVYPTIDPMIDPPDSPASSEDQFNEAENDEGGSDIEIGLGNLEDDQYSRSPAGPSRPATNGKSKGLYKPPTLDELDTLRNAEMSGGTQFSLQLDALLSSILLPTTPHPKLKALLESIHSYILSMPSLSSLPPRRAMARLKTTQIPFGGPGEFSSITGTKIEGGEAGERGKEVKWGLGWEKAEEVIIGGSWGVCGGYKKAKGEMGSIDLVVIMPKEMFSPKDRMSFRYFHKKAHYLAVICSSLNTLASSPDSPLQGCSISFSEEIDGGFSPTLIVSVGKDQGLKHRTEIHIHAAISSSTFQPSTLSPTKSLLRHPSISLVTPTPLYSSSILVDTLYKTHLLHLHRLSQTLSVPRTVESFLALWRVWAEKRGINRQTGGNGWFAAMILEWVVDGGEVGGMGGERCKVKKVRGLGKSLGYWGLMRAAWELLAHTDFEKTPVFMSTRNDSVIPQNEFLQVFQDVFVDPTGSINVFAQWEKGDIQFLQHHARETLMILEDTSADHFADVFLWDHNVGPSAYDEFILVDIATADMRNNLIDRSERPSTSQLLSSSIATILRRGFGDRANLVHVSLQPRNTLLSIGVIFNSSNATRVLDVGPTSDQASSVTTSFKDFWGEKAELRRFKDGSIAESVVWDITRPEDAALIPGRIVKHLLNRHFDIHHDLVHTISSDHMWSTIVQTPAKAREAVSKAGSEKLGFRPAMAAYDDLYKVLKSIDEELPLAILTVQPASEQLRYSSVFIPHPIDLDRFPSNPDCLKWIPHAEVILQFESSPRWPDDLAAIQKVKLAMMEKLARVIMSQRKGALVRVVFDENGDLTNGIEDHAALEVVADSGIAFRIRIYHERERKLLERVIQDDSPIFGTSLPNPPRRMAIPALETHMRRFIHLPQHHGGMAPLHHRYPSYSSATRLLKRWFGAHMLSIQVESNAVELVMAKVYLDPILHAPSSATAGFIRAMQLLAEWEWKAEPMTVPIFSVSGAGRSSESRRVVFPTDKYEGVKRVFEERRKKDEEIHHGAWIIATEEDVFGLRWTTGIGKVVAGRIKTLAKATLQVIKSTVEGKLNVKALFTTPTAEYDVLIHLDPSLLTRYALAVSPDVQEWEGKLQYKNITGQGVYGEEVRIGFDPAASFARDIQRLYGDVILVFYDEYGGSTIGLLWNPTKSQPKSFKPFLGHSTRPAKSTAALVEMNKQGVLGEIARMGKRLVMKMNVQKYM